MYAQHMQKQELVKKMNMEIENFTNALESKMDEFYLVLNSLAGFYESSDFVSREEFSIFSKHLIRRLPHLRSLAWVPKVSNEYKNKFIESVQEECCQEYRIKEFDVNGSFVEVKDREVYFPILYIEPFEKNRVALGLDNYSEKNRRQASVNASDSNIMMMTAAIVLGQDQSNQTKSVVLIYPIYEKKQSLDTFEHRRSSLMGYMTATVKVEDFLKSAFHESSEMKDMDFHIFDIQSEESKLLYSKRSGEGKVAEEFKKSVNLNLGGRSWKIIFAPTRNYRADFQPWTLWYLMGGALLVSSMLISVLLLLTGQNENTLRVVKKRTRELTKTRQELSEHNDEMEKLVYDLKDQKNNLEDQRSAMISLMEDLEEQRNQIKEQAKNLKRLRRQNPNF
jgi:CHASE1-domain containing sensor protein